MALKRKHAKDSDGAGEGGPAQAKSMLPSLLPFPPFPQSFDHLLTLQIQSVRAPSSPQQIRAPRITRPCRIHPVLAQVCQRSLVRFEVLGTCAVRLHAFHKVRRLAGPFPQAATPYLGNGLSLSVRTRKPVEQVSV